jgi:multiple sugar transport system substrate-binding protein
MKMSKKRLAIIAVVIVIIAAIGMYPILGKKMLRSRNPNTLTIYALDYNGKLNYDMEPVVNEFKEKYPDIKLNIVEFNSDKEYAKYNEKILSDTLSGEGPDIIYFDPEETNARAFQTSGMLEDLNPYIEKDKDFNKEDYNSKLLNAGLYKGKLTFIPTDYCVPSYITTKELLEKNNIKITENMSQNDFIKSLHAYISSTKSSNGKTLFAKSLDIGDFIASSGFQCVDYENKKMYFDTKEFKDIMENYKKIYNSTPKPTNNESGIEGIQGIKNGSTLFSIDQIYTSGVECFASESTIKGTTGQTQIINGFPTYKGDNKTIAIGEDLIGMSKKTLNKKAAYNFIKLVLSEKIQCGEKTYIPPINKKSQIDIKNRYLNEQVGKTDKMEKVILNRPSDDFNKYYDRITNNVDEVRILDTDLDKLIQECMTPYFEDKSSYDSALKTLENKVKLYINE